MLGIYLKKYFFLPILAFLKEITFFSKSFQKNIFLKMYLLKLGHFCFLNHLSRSLFKKKLELTKVTKI